jgi:hypothetical protein
LHKIGLVLEIPGPGRSGTGGLEDDLLISVRIKRVRRDTATVSRRFDLIRAIVAIRSSCAVLDFHKAISNAIVRERMEIRIRAASMFTRELICRVVRPSHADAITFQDAGPITGRIELVRIARDQRIVRLQIKKLRQLISAVVRVGSPGAVREAFERPAAGVVIGKRCDVCI